LDTVLSSGVVFRAVFPDLFLQYGQSSPNMFLQYAKIFFGMITETKTSRYKRMMCFKQMFVWSPLKKVLQATQGGEN
jgi:hypothetical protein